MKVDFNPQLKEWLQAWLPEASSDIELNLVAGDASPRRYYRWFVVGHSEDLKTLEALAGADPSAGKHPHKSGSAPNRNTIPAASRTRSLPRTLLVMDSPPSEKNEEFLAVHRILQESGIRVPRLYHADVDQGFMILEDLGNDTLLPLLSEHSVSVWYPKALTMLADIAGIVDADFVHHNHRESRPTHPVDGRDSLPSATDKVVSASDKSEINLACYDSALLQNELNLFPEWFVGRLLGVSTSTAFTNLFQAISALLLESASEQPQILVHRDFHSRNLMVIDNAELATIDFQDAVIGPITYDPVSLLKDCYVRWPRARQLAWLADHQTNLEARGVLKPVSRATFIRWFDLMGLQRHLKVLGIFARLCLRDGKSGYLHDLPLVLAYTREALALYAGDDVRIADFRDWFEVAVVPLCRDQPWFSDAHDHWLELNSLVRQP